MLLVLLPCCTVHQKKKKKRQEKEQQQKVGYHCHCHWTTGATLPERNDSTGIEQDIKLQDQYGYL